VTIDEDQAYSFQAQDYVYNDNDGDPFSGIQITSVSTKGELKYSGSAVSAGTICLDVTNLVYTPETNESGSPYATYQFKVKDSQGAFSSSSYTMTINVKAGNDAPTSNDAEITINEDETYSFVKNDFPFDDIDGDKFAGIRLVTLETAGELKYNGDDAETDIDYADVSKLEYTPAHNETGSPYANFNFKVIDSKGYYSQAYYAMHINVIEKNDPPEFAAKLPDTTVNENDHISWNYEVNDPEGDTLYFGLAGLEVLEGDNNPGGNISQGMQLDSLSGTFEWTVDYNSTGQYQIVISVTDGYSTVYDTTIITVNNINRLPEFIQSLPDTTIDNDTDLTFTYLAEDADEEELSYGLVNSIDGVDISEQGELLWQIPEQPAAEYEIVVYVTDNIDTVETSALITVNNVTALSAGNMIPDKYTLSQSYPNPFNPTTTIKYGLPEESDVRISVYDISGNLIETLISEHQSAGYHTTTWNASNMPTGVYFYKIRAGSFSAVKKCILLK